MKKSCLVIGLALLAVVAFSSAGQAGVCVDNDTYCNDYYFSFSKGEGAYSLHGYEYGCGAVDKVSHGALRVTGGVIYVHWSKISPGYADFGMFGIEHAAINQSSKNGPGAWFYYYLSGGSPGGHGAAESYTLRMCAPQAAVETSGPNSEGE